MADNPWDEIGDDESSGRFGGDTKKKNNSKDRARTDGNGDSFFSVFSFFSDNKGNSTSYGSSGELSVLDRFGFLKIKNNFQLFIVGLFFVVGFWILSGFYVIKQEESGIAMRFGKYVRDVDSGLHYHLPFPVEEVIKGAIKRVRVLKIGGADGVGNQGNGSRSERDFGEWVLTGDENIVNLELNVQWKISDLKKFIFSVRDKEQTIYDATQSVVREVVSTMKLADILTSGRGTIEENSKTLLQQMLNDYNMGVEIIVVQMLRIDPPAQVVDSFRDVQTARIDKESEINKAQKYRNDILPRVKGEAGKIVEDANGYAIAVVNKAKGDVSRFNQIYEQYKHAPFVTRKRMYLEVMEDIFKKNGVVVLDDNVKNIFLNGASMPDLTKLGTVQDEENKALD